MINMMMMIMIMNVVADDDNDLRMINIEINYTYIIIWNSQSKQIISFIPPQNVSLFYRNYIILWEPLSF